MMKNKFFALIFGILVFFQILCVIHFANEKQGYFVDELWSYGLSNSYYHPHVYFNDALEQKWVLGEYFREYLEVLPEQRFEYNSVIYNQMQDVHPPLFYMILHTVCSLFPNTFSKWYGIIPNIIYFVICNLFLYQLSKKLFQNKWLALIPMLAYGFSAGALSNVIYIRMYMLLTVWVLIILYLHVKWLIQDQMTQKQLFILIITAYMGYMSHYYFFVIAFFSSIFYCLYLISKKRKTDLIWYCTAMFISCLLVVLTFPIAYKKLFFGQRGSEAVYNLFEFKDVLGNAKRYWDIIGEGLFANCQNFLGRIILYCGTCACVSWFCKNNKSKKLKIILEKADEEKRFIVCLFLIFVCFCYFLIVLKISPYQVDRYVFCIYPEITLVMLYLIFNVIYFWSSYQIAVKVVLMWAVMFAISGVSGKHIQYLYKNHAKNVEIIKQYENLDCLYVTWDYYKLVGNALELQHMGRVFTEVPNRINELPQILDFKQNNLIVYLDEQLEQEEILNKICDVAGFQTWKYLFESRCLVYELER